MRRIGSRRGRRRRGDEMCSCQMEHTITLSAPTLNYPRKLLRQFGSLFGSDLRLRGGAISGTPADGDGAKLGAANGASPGRKRLSTAGCDLPRRPGNAPLTDHLCRRV